ncbi:LAME_0G16248g1_1 [Lachancea meyersii CBS 8951]|uniref:LAME_0G16248g1_1 n=1 Tax=Lachancea meyersii CBS 8951 TaxID=1266667 RepID=A0A1G4KB87_9SACH|nr:LAME_0G16248g1_1 [Lachancea meyersii CBS 8951]
MSVDCPPDKVLCELVAKDHDFSRSNGPYQFENLIDNSSNFGRNGAGYNSQFQDHAKPEEVLLDGLHLGQPVFAELGDWSVHNPSSVTPPLLHSPEDSHESASSRGLNKPVRERDGYEQNSLPEEALSEQEILARKKAQNRAAQKAFRERKEARLKELETKLSSSERDRQALLKELEDLKKHNLEITTENRLLRSKTESNSAQSVRAEPAKYHFPSQREFIRATSGDHSIDSLDELASTSYERGGEKLLTLPATWEYLHELSKNNEFDVYSVMENLRGQEVCHGYGPAYRQDVVDNIVRHCA